jgi:hypothetical protein
VRVSIEFPKISGVSNDISSKRGLRKEGVSWPQASDSSNGRSGTNRFLVRKLEDNGISYVSSDEADVGRCDDARRRNESLSLSPVSSPT